MAKRKLLKDQDSRRLVDIPVDEDNCGPRGPLQALSGGAASHRRLRAGCLYHVFRSRRGDRRNQVGAEDGGLSPLLAASHVNGKALHVHGYLGEFENATHRTAKYLQRPANTGVTLVGIDPSMTLAFCSEYMGVTDPKTSVPVLLAQEWLAAHLERLTKNVVIVSNNKCFHLLPHCTERGNAPASLDQLEAVFEAVNLKLKTSLTGCCGMAGTFGHETRNRAVSEQLYVMSWAGPLAAASDDTVVMATGYSCRSQAMAIDEIRPLHPIEVLNGLLERPTLLQTGTNGGPRMMK